MRNGTFNELEIKSWADLLARKRQFSSDKWIFRGQQKKTLITTLEAACNRFSINLATAPERTETGFSAIEHKLLREFQRRYHFYSAREPGQKDHLQWLSLMQHYGAPTRLLDWTYSYFVAAYFALAEAEKDAMIWALDITWLKNSVHKLTGEDLARKLGMKRSHKGFYEVFLERKNPSGFVLPVNPFHLNQRLSIQQGVFLCPGNVYEPFESNLLHLECFDLRSHLHKLVLKQGARPGILQELYKMNIDGATLFPGLDGFARSLRTRIGRINGLPVPSWALEENA